MYNGLTMLLHGPAKIGKTRLAATCPGKILFLDAEGGTRWLPMRMKPWDPRTQAPPEDDGTWDACVVFVTEFAQLDRAHQWLVSGKHPFDSVVLDNVTDAQIRCIEKIAGTRAMEQQDWGALLREVDDLVIKLRDLVLHPTKPLKAVVVVAATAERGKAGVVAPMAQGQLKSRLPYRMDVIGYLYGQFDAEGTLRRGLMVQPFKSEQQEIEAGDRTGMLVHRYGPVVPVATLEYGRVGTDIAEMVSALNEGRESA